MSLLGQLFIVARQAGLNKIEERHALNHVEAFYAEDKYVMARLTDGRDTFILGMGDKNGAITRNGHYFSLKAIECWLGAHGASQFVRTHRHWIANMNHVKTYRAPENGNTGGTLITYSQVAIEASRRGSKATRRAWRNGMSVTAMTLLVTGLLVISPNSNATDEPTPPAPGQFTPLPTPTPPVIVAKQCSSTGCWLHFADGTSKFVAGVK